MRHLAAAIALFSIAFTCKPATLQAQGRNESSEQSETEPQYVPPPAWQSVEIGNYYLHKKKYRGALGRFKEAATTDPDYAPAYLGLGEVYEKMGQKRNALGAYRKYLDALPSEKQADEATSTHKAIKRLERELSSEQSQTEKSRTADR